jgi:hypothetical protein
MENSFILDASYPGDIANFKKWFADDLKLTPNKVGSITGLISRIRLTPGLMHDIDFVNDIYRNANLGVDFINVMYVKPGNSTMPWISKVRTKAFIPGVDTMFDPTLEDRKCLLVIPLNFTPNKSKIHWIADSEKVNNENFKSKKFPTTESITITDTPFVVRSNKPVYIDNTLGEEILFLLHIAFESNTDYETVKELQHHFKHH